MMRHGIVRVHGQSALQRADGKLRFTLLLENFPEQNVRARGSGIKPDGALQQFFSFVEFFHAGIGVSKFVVRGGIARIELQLLLKLVRGFGDLGVVEIQLTEEKVREWKLRI